MAYDGWVEFNDVEVINVSRTAQLAEAMGIDAVWITPESVQWIEDARGGTDWDVVTSAPWYDAGYPASAEFAGLIPLSLAGLDDSSLEASSTEYINDGGNPGRARNGTQAIVASVALFATTDRGAEYGKRWMDHVLRGSDDKTFCVGSDLRYFRYVPPNGEFITAIPEGHRRDVKLTRGASVTRKRLSPSSVTWFATFTLTAGDSYEYGDAIHQFDMVGNAAPTGVSGPAPVAGNLTLTQEGCPVYDYTPLYDPLYPALVPSPTPPDFLPAGWTIETGDSFQRRWVRLAPVEPSHLRMVPLMTLLATSAERMVRVSIWPGASLTDNQCGPLWSAVITYLPPGIPFLIDGEQKASYVSSTVVRRTDSLVYGPDANPLEWTAFNDPDGLLVTIDRFNGLADDNLTFSLSFIPKSD